MRLAITGLVLLAVAYTAMAEESDRHRLVGAIETSWVYADSDLTSWLDHGNGKLRYDDHHDGLRVNRAFLDYRGRLSNTVFARGTLNFNGDGGEYFDVTEAFVDWRPVPRSAWRLRARAGAFYPHISLENNDAGWGNRYGMSSSVINTWLGEELRIIGTEVRLQRDFARFPQHRVSVEGGVFFGNDPTGALLTWRGWSGHDRQTGLAGKLPLPDVAAIEPWDPGGLPPSNFRPFQEIDNRPGFYGGAQWQWGERMLVKLFRYDNRANPEDTSGQDYAWETWFDHVGVQLALPGEFGLMGQWIDGGSKMGPNLGPWHVEDVDFEAWFATLTRAFGEHRLSVRHESFKLKPFNDPAGFTNQDIGNAMSLNWSYRIHPQLRLGAELYRIKSEHCRTLNCAWVLNGLPRKTDEKLFQVGVRWYFRGEASR